MATSTRTRSTPITTATRKALVKQVVTDPGGQDLPKLPTFAVVVGDAKADKANWTGVYAHSEQAIALYAASLVYAAWFDGDVQIVGELTQESGVAKIANMSISGDIVMANADVAEEFDVAGPDAVDAGTVMVLDTKGTVSASRQEYDKCVAGVISGAGEFKPGIVLDKRKAPGNRQPIALMGKVFCKVDARFGAIGLGDLLTTSLTPGHAMKASDPLKAFGAVIGKALRPWQQGQGLIPVLVSLK